jgi:uncharacterized protein (TIGR02594 family)
MTTKIVTTAYDVARHFIGMKEYPGAEDNPFIVWCLELCGFKGAHDEEAWCAAFVNGICYILGLPRSGSAAARSFLAVGMGIGLETAESGNDIVILKRGGPDQPGPGVLNAPGHIGFFAGTIEEKVMVLGGNQNNSINIMPFPKDRVLGVRRLY